MEFAFTLTGLTPYLMHADDVMAADTLTAWRKDPANKTVSVPGDDRSPPWSWQTYLYTDGTHLAMPCECIMACLCVAGTKIPAPKGKGTFKSLSQSGLVIPADHCRFTTDGHQVAMADIRAFKDEKFSEHIERCRALGFDLLVKRATIGSSKNVRVRPKFEHWQVEGTIMVSEPSITAEVLNQMFGIAGKLVGLGDWRPSAPKKPGPHGMFAAELKPAKAGRKSA